MYLKTKSCILLGKQFRAFVTEKWRYHGTKRTSSTSLLIFSTFPTTRINTLGLGWIFSRIRHAGCPLTRCSNYILFNPIQHDEFCVLWNEAIIKRILKLIVEWPVLVKAVGLCWWSPVLYHRCFSFHRVPLSICGRKTPYRT